MNSFASPQIFTALPFSRTDTGKPSADDLYSRIFDAILEQRIHAASRFTEDSLAQMFSARRSDIRGVLTQLSHQQIIILRTNHRPRVAAPDAEQTRQTLHARRLTEITLVRLACQQPRPQDLQRLRDLIESERQCLGAISVARRFGCRGSFICSWPKWRGMHRWRIFLAVWCR